MHHTPPVYYQVLGISSQIYTLLWKTCNLEGFIQLSATESIRLWYAARTDLPTTSSHQAQRKRGEMLAFAFVSVCVCLRDEVACFLHFLRKNIRMSFTTREGRSSRRGRFVFTVVSNSSSSFWLQHDYTLYCYYTAMHERCPVPCPAVL